MQEPTAVQQLLALLPPSKQGVGKQLLISMRNQILGDSILLAALKGEPIFGVQLDDQRSFVLVGWEAIRERLQVTAFTAQQYLAVGRTVDRRVRLGQWVGNARFFRLTPEELVLAQRLEIVPFPAKAKVSAAKSGRPKHVDGAGYIEDDGKA